MKNRSRIIALVLILFVIVVAIVLQGCGENLALSPFLQNIKDTFSSTKEVTQIQVKDTTIYLAPEGDAREYQLVPIVYPLDAKNQDVYFKHVDSTDRDYLNISLDGLLFARGLKTDEYGNNIPIPVKLISADNPEVSLVIEVIIESVAVTNLFFQDSEMEMELHKGAIKLEPIFKPAHALKGRNLTYESGDKTIATVDRSGYVTPVSIGVVDVWAISRPEGSKLEIKAHVIISVIYAPLNYRLDMITPQSGLNQILGSNETLSFVINRLDTVCDPSPEINWYYNTTRINEVGVKDNNVLNFKPGNLPSGKYRIVAVLRNSSQEQRLTSAEINVYYPLANFNIDIWNSDSTFSTGDIMRVGATYATSTFPPESYKWEITTPSGREVLYQKSTGTMSDVADLEYSFREAGNYSLKAMAVVKGLASNVYSNTLSFTVASASFGTDIVGLSIEGKKVDLSYLPYVFWDAIPYNTNYEAEIRQGSQVIASYDSTDPDDEDNFDKNGFYIDGEIVGFNESFEVRVKGGRYNWSEWKQYQANTITPMMYPFFDEVIPGFNRYISSVEDLGRLLNYTVIFRPEDLMSEAQYDYDTFDLDLYIPLVYENISEEIYTKGAAGAPSTTDPGRINLYYVLAFGMGTYAESTSYGLTFGDIVNKGGRNQFLLQVQTAKEPTSYEDEEPLTELRYITHFASTPRSVEESLSIDSLPEYPVSTSNQLFWAAINGYKPVPVSGSAAESVYRIARKVLFTIISSGMSDEQKTHAIYDWLSLNVGYNHALLAATQNGGAYDSTADSFFMEGVFKGVINSEGEVTEVLRGTAVCDGLAKAFSLLASMEGINNYKLTGVLNGPDPIGHAWNKVMIDGLWYVVDSTWASDTVEDDWTVGTNSDEYEILSHRYLFMTDSQASGARKVYGIYPSTPTSRYFGGFSEHTSLDPEYDSLIDSDSELVYYLGTYLPLALQESVDLWGEVMLSDVYLDTLWDIHVTEGGTMSYDQYVTDAEFKNYIANLQNEVRNNLVGVDIDIRTFEVYLYVRVYPIS